ncbi:laforin-like [Equus asinus]|uniref:laforin-like n=1 Tax=Equus asinus TaxID=9793 RepID=UPI0038F6E8C1
MLPALGLPDHSTFALFWWEGLWKPPSPPYGASSFPPLPRAPVPSLPATPPLLAGTQLRSPSWLSGTAGQGFGSGAGRGGAGRGFGSRAGRGGWGAAGRGFGSRAGRAPLARVTTRSAGFSLLNYQPRSPSPERFRPPPSPNYISQGPLRPRRSGDAAACVGAVLGSARRVCAVPGRWVLRRAVAEGPAYAGPPAAVCPGCVPGLPVADFAAGGGRVSESPSVEGA